MSQTTAHTTTPPDRIPLNGNNKKSSSGQNVTADVDVIGSHVEVTIQLGERAMFGLALSTDEADRLGTALLAAVTR